MTQAQRTLLLDMDGTLLDLHFDNYFWLTHFPKAYAEFKKVELHQAKAMLEPHFEGMRGSLNWYCTDYWSDLTGLNVIDLKVQIKHKIGFLPSVEQTLKALRQQYGELVIVTNAHPDSVSLKHEHTGVVDYVDRLISSHHLGAPKEDQLFWIKLQNQLGFESSKVCFVDDSPSVLRSAKQFGITSLFQITCPDSKALKPSDNADLDIKGIRKIRNIEELLICSPKPDLNR